MLDVMLRATDRAAWLRVAEVYGVLVREGDELHPAQGVHVDEIGPVTLEVDAEGLPVRVDPRHHVNLRVAEPALSAPHPEFTTSRKCVVMQELWRTRGVLATPNKQETARMIDGVELIEGVATPMRVWL